MLQCAPNKPGNDGTRASQSRQQAKRDETSTVTRGASPKPTARRKKTGDAIKWSKPYSKKPNVRSLSILTLITSSLTFPVDFFDSTTPANPHANTSTNTDDALVEQFRTEYYESMEAKQQARKPPAPPVKGAPPPITGPKLGGSKSARAKMHKLQQEEAARKKR